MEDTSAESVKVSIHGQKQGEYGTEVMDLKKYHQTFSDAFKAKCNRTHSQVEFKQQRNIYQQASSIRLITNKNHIQQEE